VILSGGLLVGGQVATAVVLLVGAGLLLRTLLAIDSVYPGYRAESVLTMLVDPPGPQRVPWLQFYEAVGQEVMALPGVRGVAWATTLPLGRSYQGPFFFEIVGDPPAAESRRPTADYQIVSPSYFTTLDLPVVAGRTFDDRDRPGATQVCMVNEAFVRRHLQGRSPIGVRVAIRSTALANAPVVREIVGVARQVKARPNETEELIQIYVPLARDTPGDIFMLVRPASGPAEVLAPSVRRALASVDKQQLVSVPSVMTLDDVAAAATARHRFRAILVFAFAGLALVLAMIGLFGIVAIFRPAARAGFRRPESFGRYHDRRAPARRRRRQSSDCHRCRRRARSFHCSGAPHRHDAVRRGAARPDHLRVGRGSDGPHRDRGNDRSGMARRTHRSRDCVAKRVTQPVAARNLLSASS
jgi:putative ABC transport system permease protein